MQLRLSHKVFILVVALLAFELIFISLLGWLLNEAEKETQAQAKAREIVSNAQLMLTATYRVAVAATSLAVPGEDDFDENIQEVQRRFAVEKQLVSDDPLARAAVNKLNDRITHGMNILKRMRTMAMDAPFNPEARKEFYRGRTITAQLCFPLVRNLQEFVEYEEQKQKIDPKAEAHKRDLVKFCLLAGVLLNLILAMVGCAYLTGGVTKRIERLRENTLKLGLGQALSPPDKGTDDIAKLDRFLHETAAILVEAQRREKLVIENAVDVICSLDRSGKFTNVNLASTKVFGYEPEELIGSYLSRIVLPEDVESTNQSIQNAIESATDSQGAKHVALENRIVRKDGTTVDILWSTQWSRVEKTLFCVAHDITERKEVENMKKELVGIVSHELKTPLTSIQGFLTLLSENLYGELTAQGMQRVTIAERNVEHLIKLVSDLLAVEKLESGRAELALSIVAMQNVFDRALENVSQFARDHNVIIEMPQTDIEIEADEDRLTQVLINLLSNAVKYSPQQSTVKLTVEKSTDWMELRVIDTGRGVPLAAQKRIFERFQQVERAEDERKGGTGLGLAICKSIVEQHGGLIGVDSEEGKGSSFWLRLPITSNAREVASKKTAAESNPKLARSQASQSS